jgi:phosphoribosylaminoimidazolecarboxamide formyltransferase / IMP cyclohydrolase
MPEPLGAIAVGVSGAGSNLRALVSAERRGELGGQVRLVFADRPCPALEWAASEGLATALVPGGEDDGLSTVLEAAAPDVIVLAGYMRLIGPRVLDRYAGRILNTHPSLLPAFPGAHAVDDALAAGVTVTGCTVHLVDAVLDGGPMVLQAPVVVRAGDDADVLRTRIQAAEHRLLPRAVALLLAGAISIVDGHVRIDHAVADARIPVPRRALLSVSDKTGLVAFAAGLVAARFELVSTGGTARTLRDAGLPVTDVAGVTGLAEMLDGRVKTLHPSVHGGILADRRRPAHRQALSEAAIAPFELVVVNLYPFAAAAERPGISIDELIEEIDIGGPSMVRAAAKNHASVGIVTDPEDYDVVLAAIRAGDALPEALRRRLAVAAFRHTAAYDARIAGELGTRLLDGDTPETSLATASHGAAVAAAAGASAEPLPSRLDLALTLALDLRYGENPHQAAAMYLLPDADQASGPFARGVDLRGGKPLSYNNLLDAAAASGVARDLRGAACVIVKHANPCGAAEATEPIAAWEGALAGDPVSAFGGVVALTRPVDAAMAERLASLFLEVVVVPGLDEPAAAILAGRPNLRVVVDPHLESPPLAGREIRSAGGAVLVTEADTGRDDPTAWSVATSRQPTSAERRDLDLAWRVARHVKSNAIVLVRDGAVVGVGAGQMSRVDSARLACAKAGDRALGAACASDAFFPFADAVETCLAAGVTAFVQPGGSQRDAETLAVVEAAGAAMLLTGRRHFRH